ncbi:MAG: sigma-E factor negative regulatory protein [Methyloglobulus sp.]|nr:sigma-E factor negative regulatory protein [Methyloglobulus sp.]
MQKDVNEKISQLIDGELSHNETLEFLKKIRSDAGLRQKMCRYDAISQALKTDEFYQIRPDFSDKIFQQIQLESTYLLPQRSPANKQPSRTRLFAVAASTIAVAVLVGQNLYKNKGVTNPPTLAATTLPQQSQPIAIAQLERATQQKRQPVNTQFNDYLQAHNNSVYTNGEATFQPYAKVTAYGRE